MPHSGAEEVPEKAPGSGGYAGFGASGATEETGGGSDFASGGFNSASADSSL